MTAHPELPGRSLTGQVAIVTGASRRDGIGAAICMALARAGADILFTHWQPYDEQTTGLLDRDGPARLEEALDRLGVRASGLGIDLSEPDAPERVIESAIQWLGSASILVNNATHSTDSDWETLTGDVLDAHYAVNLRGNGIALRRICPEVPGRQATRRFRPDHQHDFRAEPGTDAR